MKTMTVDEFKVFLQTPGWNFITEFKPEAREDWGWAYRIARLEKVTITYNETYRLEEETIETSTEGALQVYWLEEVAVVDGNGNELSDGDVENLMVEFPEFSQIDYSEATR